MTELLIIVPHERPELWDFWTQWFSGIPHVRVILDRRGGERRRRGGARDPERRRTDRRRQPGINDEPYSRGFEIIRQRQTASPRSFPPVMRSPRC